MEVVELSKIPEIPKTFKGLIIYLFKLSVSFSTSFFSNNGFSFVVVVSKDIMTPPHCLHQQKHIQILSAVTLLLALQLPLLIRLSLY